MKKLLLLTFNQLFLLSCCFASLVKGQAHEATDTIPYQGFRIHLTNVQLLKQKNNRVKIRYDMVNTGRKDIVSTKVTPLPASLVIDFEDALKSCNCILASYIGAIQNQFKSQSIKLSTGQTIKDNILELDLDQQYLPPAATGEDHLDSRLANKPAGKEKEESTKTIQAPDKKLRTEKDQENPSDSAIAGVSKTTAVTINIADRSNRISAEGSKAIPAKSAAMPVKTAETGDIPVEEDFSGDSPEILTEKGVNISSQKLCPDVVVSDLVVKKQSKNWVVLEYTLTNIGNKAAKITSNNNSIGEVFAINAFLSSGTTLTRGSLPLGGSFVKSVPSNKEGILKANNSYKGVIKLDIQKKTRFTPYLILSLDPYLSLEECDRSNNTGHVLLK